MSTTISGTNGVTFPDSTSMQTGQQACKAWVNFNGVGTVAIRGSYNVSSITDNGTGTYSINFTVDMSDNNYATCATGNDGNYATTFQASFAQTPSAVRVLVYYGASAYDVSVVSAAIFSN
jgi:hypothetical protein